MGIVDDLVSSLGEDSAVREVHACVFWTAVVSRNCGLASTLELAQYVESDNLLEASIGMAAINSLIDIDKSKCTEQNAFDILAEIGRGRNIAIVGHFPWVSRLGKLARKVWVIEEKPQEGALPAEAAEGILPQADVVGITGTSFINHTIEKLLHLSKNGFIVVIGPTSPLSPVLFDWGVDVIAGVKVAEPEKTIRSISEGAIFSQVEGVKLVTMAKGGSNDPAF